MNCVNCGGRITKDGCTCTIKLQNKINRWAKTAAIKQKQVAMLAGLLSEVAPIVCGTLCPSVKKTGTEWPHVDLCQRIRKAITR